MDSLMILGASGFIGNSVLSAALQAQDLQVYALEHRRPVTTEKASGFITLKGSLRHIRLPCPLPDNLIHAARHASSNGFAGRKFRSMQAAMGNRKIIKLVHQGKAHIRYISGSLMYGKGGRELITESNPLHPISFARQYLQAEQPFNRAVKKGDPFVQVIRAPWIFGKGSWFQRFYLDTMKNEGYVPLYGTGQNWMTLIDLEDLGKSIIALKYAPFVPVINLFMEDYITQEQFATLLSQYSKLPVKPIRTSELKSDYEPAVREAFATNIKLGSKYHFKSVSDAMRFKSVEEMIASRLPAFLHNV